MYILSKGPTRPDEDNIHEEKIMHVLYTNADCLHNKLSELILLIGSLKHKLNIIALTEFRIKVIKMYKFSRLISWVTSNILMTSRAIWEEYYYMLIVILSHLESPLTQFLKCVNVKIKGANGAYLTVCNVYRNPNSSCENDTKLSELINNLCSNTKEIFQL